MAAQENESCDHSKNWISGVFHLLVEGCYRLEIGFLKLGYLSQPSLLDEIHVSRVLAVGKVFGVRLELHRNAEGVWIL